MLRILNRKLKSGTAILNLVCLVSFAFAQAAVPPPADVPSQTQTSAPEANADATDNGWPREITADSGEQITVYQPQIERWKDNQIEERAAISVENKASPEPTYGVIWFKARTETDKSNHLVTLEDVRITQASFPSSPNTKDDTVQKIRPRLPSLVREIALDRLQANLAVTKAEEKTSAPDLKNTPPQIIYSKTPSLLVLIDGDPVLRESGVQGYLRVINTRALMALDQSNGKYYLFVGGHWMESSSPTGKWNRASKAPKGLNEVKQAAVEQKQVDLLEIKAGTNPSLTNPTVYVATGPAELIQTEGAPQVQPISGTNLMYVQNSPDSIFIESSDSNYYVLISGRWYRSKSLNGPWANVSAKKLPSDFAKIPDTHPKATALASVAGTPQAQEAGIANEVPQTATIDRAQASLAVQYDGAPSFKPIEGTPLQYAQNTATPVIQIDPNTYFAVQNAVWFSATSPQGPWVAAAQVPAVIYTIPPSSPLYYVTYVRVYGSNKDVVYDGYTPGYLASYASSDGVVVYGTGYYYQPWVQTVWYGPPVTYGLGWYWGPGFAWGFGAGLFVGAAFSPWWGPYHGWGWGWGPGWGHPWGPGWHGGPGRIIGSYNVYRNWNGHVVRNSWNNHEFANRSHGPQFSRANNVYAGRNGEVYRYNSQGNSWERNTGHGWESTARSNPTSRAPSNRNESNTNEKELEQNRTARTSGEQRWNSFRGSVARAPSAPSSSRHYAVPSGGGGFGGGSHGGGHGRG